MHISFYHKVGYAIDKADSNCPLNCTIGSQSMCLPTVFAVCGIGTISYILQNENFFTLMGI